MILLIGHDNDVFLLYVGTEFQIKYLEKDNGRDIVIPTYLTNESVRDQILSLS